MSDGKRKPDGKADQGWSVPPSWQLPLGILGFVAAAFVLKEWLGVGVGPYHPSRTGACAECLGDGTAEATCGSCDGRGYYAGKECDRCGGDGEVVRTCPYCAGSGKKPGAD